MCVRWQLTKSDYKSLCHVVMIYSKQTSMWPPIQAHVSKRLTETSAYCCRGPSPWSVCCSCRSSNHTRFTPLLVGVPVSLYRIVCSVSFVYVYNDCLSLAIPLADICLQALPFGLIDWLNRHSIFLPAIGRYWLAHCDRYPNSLHCQPDT